MNTLNKIVTTAIDTLYDSNPGLFSGQSKAFYVNALQDSVSSLIEQPVTLLTTEPDYEKVYLQLAQNLSSEPEWYDLITSATGAALLRTICSGIAFAQFSIERAVQETYLHNASSENSIFTATRMLGVRPRRRLPAVTDVDLSRDDSIGNVIIPKLSQFTVNTIKFYNREQLTFQDSQLTLQSRLYQGTVVTEELTSTGEPFQTFELGFGNSTIANSDFQVLVDDKEWQVNNLGLWNLTKDGEEYFETTSENGNISLHFGNFAFGRIPPQGSIITVKYVETLGPNGNISASNLEVTLDEEINNFIDITGFTTSNVIGGSEALDSNYYKQMAPHHFSAKRRAVRRSDYRAIATTYSDIHDALFRGQAELAPGRRSMMNVIGVTLLTEVPWTQGQFNNWGDQFKENHAIYQCDFLKIDPINVIVDVDATIFCKAEANLLEVEQELSSLIRELFRPKLNHLGYSIYKTDITDVLNGRNLAKPDEQLERLISHVILNEPTTDTVFTDKTYYASLGNLNLDIQYTSRGGFSGRLDLNPVVG